MRGARSGMSGCGADNGTVGTMGAGSFPADGATCGRFSASSRPPASFTAFFASSFSVIRFSVG